jgi:hypothetical protein
VPAPTYTSSAPLPRGYTPPDEAFDYAPPANPYGPAPDRYRAPGEPASNRNRIIVLAAAGLLGLLLVGFAIGQLIGRSSGPTTPAAGVSQQSGGQQAPPATAHPPVTPTATATSASQGAARFQRVTVQIPGRCTTGQGCPIQVTLKNNGERGGGTVTVTLTDSEGGGNTVATFTGPIPTTDAGATVDVSGFATGDQLPAYLRNNGTVYIASVDVKNG